MINKGALAILPHDDTVSIVQIQGTCPDNDCVWVTFGVITSEGFNPCFATIQVKPSDLRF